jgi:NitT/TauT family transport system permease protein
LTAFVQGIWSGELIAKTAISLSVLLRGYLLGVVLAFVLTSLAVSTRFGRDLLSMLTAMFNPLPSIALLPLALLWFGLGTGSLLFVLVHSVLWPLALNTYSGFQSVPETLRMTGRNYGLKGLRHVLLILVPAALPSILAGLRVGWAFAWRTLIAAELVFGASSGNGGLGWYIFQNRNELYTDRVFAGLAAVIVIGLNAWLNLHALSTGLHAGEPRPSRHSPHPFGHPTVVDFSKDLRNTPQNILTGTFTIKR